MLSNDVVVRVENVSKCYHIYDHPQDRLKQAIVPKVCDLIRRPAKVYSRQFWALRDVSFEVGRGDAVGIIGRNGSGKSTLLQIITGVLQPSSGTAETSGRVGALLELGSGFNPEFTGRENIFLNASILGVSETEITKKFDYIAAFADIGDHLEQPVKTYSSGMSLRLAFAVQIAIDADVLIIDEALAVGDARFQLKCFRRLDELKEAGTTILFVSHSTELVRSFCNAGLVLEGGEVKYWGDAKTATTRYYSILFPEAGASTHEDENNQPSATENSRETGTGLVLENPEPSDPLSFGVGGAKLNRLEINGIDIPNVVSGGQSLVITCTFSWEPHALRNLVTEHGYEPNITLGIAVQDKKGNYLFGCNGFDKEICINVNEGAKCRIHYRLVFPHLLEGDYFLMVAIALGNLKHHVQLRWYDCLVQLKCVKSEANVFGLFAVDYATDYNIIY